MIKPGVVKLSKDWHATKEDNYIVIVGKDGQRYYFGHLLNAYLVPQKGGSNFTLWSWAAGAAIANGLNQKDLPDVGRMFGNAAETITTGKAEYGVLSVCPKEHSPHLSPKQALSLLWPHVKIVLSHTKPFGEKGPKVESLSVKYWPAVTAVIAAEFLRVSKPQLDPLLALNLVMESAILMSKVDPSLVPQQVQDAKL